MKTLQQQETEAILAMAERIKELEQALQIANDRVRQLESQVYGGSTQ
jgi:LPS O-antigen subunit length determinant protein (WzzB/FepE family)